MILDNMKHAVGPVLGRTSLLTKRYAPELCLAGGVVSGVSAGVLLARAHKRSEEELEVTLNEIADLRWDIEEANKKAVEETGHEAISKAEAQKGYAPLYWQLVLDAAKLYGPAILMGTSSIVLILASHGLLRNRNRALIGTIAILERSFSTYRKRVVSELGDEADERFYYGADVRNVTNLEVGKDGKKKKKRSKKNHIPEEYDPMMYSREFDSTNPRWSPDRTRNEFFLHSLESQFYDKLILNGHVLLNDVYESLGFERTSYGAIVGWSEKVSGDGYISFGLDNDINQREGDNRWILDFNVSGSMYKEI